MDPSLHIEIIGYSDAECGPFPCDPDRTCGLEECYPSGSFTKAVEALRAALSRRFGRRITLTVTFLDDGIPDRVKAIIEKSHPPLPMVLLDGKLAPVGRISFTRIAGEAEAALPAQGTREIRPDSRS